MQNRRGAHMQWREMQMFASAICIFDTQNVSASYNARWVALTHSGGDFPSERFWFYNWLFPARNKGHVWECIRMELMCGFCVRVWWFPPCIFHVSDLWMLPSLHPSSLNVSVSSRPYRCSSSSLFLHLRFTCQRLCNLTAVRLLTFICPFSLHRGDYVLMSAHFRAHLPQYHPNRNRVI